MKARRKRLTSEQQVEKMRYALTCICTVLVGKTAKEQLHDAISIAACALDKCGYQEDGSPKTARVAA
jgi:hypothetical protein